MGTNYYLEKLYQDMRLRSYSEHTQDVYGRAVRNFSISVISLLKH